MRDQIFIGTSGWHYNDWIGQFYPEDTKGYNELKYHAQFFNTVENNSSFYRISKESTYKTWTRMVPANYRFSIKLNKTITHDAGLLLSDGVRANIDYILDSTQILGDNMGAILIQLPASFNFDLLRLDKFLYFFTTQSHKYAHRFDLAIEFRNKYWLVSDTFNLLAKYDVALVTSQSSRYPISREITADICYIRMHGPAKLFASKYSIEELNQWAEYISDASARVKRIYVYFNNDYNGYAIENAQQLHHILFNK